MIQGRSLPTPRAWLSGLKTAATEVHRWPLTIQLYVVALVVLYAQILWETAQVWFTNDNYSHGVFIFPISAWLLWIQRKQLRQAVYQPTIWGLVPLGLGLILEILGYLLNIKFVAMVSLIPVLAGSLLILYGKELWKIARFAVYFLFFAAPWPGYFLTLPSHWIQNASTVCSVSLMRIVGYPIIQTGNIIQIPGMALEVA